MHINIGTTSGASDVVGNGVTKHAYNFQSHTAVFPASANSTEFFMFMSEGMPLM